MTASLTDDQLQANAEYNRLSRRMLRMESCIGQVISLLRHKKDWPEDCQNRIAVALGTLDAALAPDESE